MADWDKIKIITEMAKVYTDSQLFGYPEFAKKKLPSVIGFCEDTQIPKFETRDQVLEWIDKNMSEEQIAYVGF